MATTRGGKRTGGGGRLQRTATVTIRLDPKVRYLAELAARTQRRTVSSFIEWVIEQSLERVIIKDAAGTLSTLSEASETLWDVEESDRFVKLAQTCWPLLTFDEQVLWKRICARDDLWIELDGRGCRSVNVDALRAQWTSLKEAA